jgi:NADH-quinone oxidoreductase subunit K
VVISAADGGGVAHGGCHRIDSVGTKEVGVMTAVPASAYLTLAAFLFAIGAAGVLIKRNPIVIFMCIELMLNAVNLTFLTFALHQPDFRAQVAGHVFVLFVIGVAAAEVAIGLGIIVAIFRLRETIDIDSVNLLRE